MPLTDVSLRTHAHVKSAAWLRNHVGIEGNWIYCVWVLLQMYPVLVEITLSPAKLCLDYTQDTRVGDLHTDLQCWQHGERRKKTSSDWFKFMIMNNRKLQPCNTVYLMVSAFRIFQPRTGYVRWAALNSKIQRYMNLYPNLRKFPWEHRSLLHHKLAMMAWRNGEKCVRKDLIYSEVLNVLCIK